MPRPWVLGLSGACLVAAAALLSPAADDVPVTLLTGLRVALLMGLALSLAASQRLRWWGVEGPGSDGTGSPEAPVAGRPGRPAERPARQDRLDPRPPGDRGWRELEPSGEEEGTEPSAPTQYDGLTGLPNRRLLKELLASAMARADRSQQGVALLLVDLDRFRMINQTLGYEAGDSVIRAVAGRMRQSLRRMDTVVAARFQGAMFALVLEGVRRERQTEDPSRWPEHSIAQRLLGSLRAPFMIEGREVFLTASIGIAVYPLDAGDEGDLVTRADVAVGRAKQDGGNTFRFFTADMSARFVERLVLEGQLRHAIARGELTLRYQPKVEVSSGRIVGLEALVRWMHPDLGLISPADFIPIAEESDLIEALDRWVLERACRELRGWQRSGVPIVPVSVNVSARQLRRADLAPSVAEVLRRTGLDSRYLELEITESVLIQDREAGRSVLTQLRAMGLRLCIDDFGMGYSSLAYLRELPIDGFKLDRSFVAGLPVDPSAAAIASTIIALGQSLNLDVVAEGVETEDQLAFLSNRGCAVAQGYLLGRPLSADDVVGLLRTCAPTIPSVPDGAEILPGVSSGR